MTARFDQLPPHRRLVGYLEAGLDCLEAAVSITVRTQCDAKFIMTMRRVTRWISKNETS